MISADVIAKYKLSPYQVDNLVTLANFLESDKIPPPRFDISSYIFVPDGSPVFPFNAAEYYNECGTTACAVGHGPLAGIPPLPDEGWSSYSARVFGARFDRDPFTFMFGGDWKDFPDQNTAKATAKRIKYFLAYGVPEYYGPILSGIWRHQWSKGTDLWMGLDYTLESA